MNRIPPRFSPEIEEEILKFWVENRIYEKAKKKNKGKKKFYYLDGPPYTTGEIHLGHSWGKALRDSLLRYKRKRGFDVFDRPGFDMHGLPIEVKVEKALGIKTKKDVYNIGPEKFVEKAREFSIENMEKMIKDFKRLGVWLDWDNPYMTISNEYIESIWFLFKKAWEKGLLYEGERVVHWCPRCQTALSRFEIELATYEAWYKPIKDPSIYVKFKLKNEENKYLLIWTTTPWTLTYNLGVMANPSVYYVEVQVGNEIWILAKDRLEEVMKKIGVSEYKLLREFLGEELEGKEYIPVFYEELKEELDKIKKEQPNAFTVWLSEEYVTTEEGTGLVHAAPGCGPEDQEVGLRYGVKPWNTLNEEGKVTKLKAFEGWRAKKDDLKWVELLEKKGNLLKLEWYEHEYPHCWRCSSPVVFRTTKQWFFNIQKIKSNLLEDIENVYWVPEFSKEVMRNIIEKAPDWVITRQRFWGTPIPVWKCENNHIFVAGSVEDLEKISGKEFKMFYIIEKKEGFDEELIDWYLEGFEKVKGDKERIREILKDKKRAAIFVDKEIEDEYYEELKKEGWFVLRYKGTRYNITRVYNYDLHKAFLDSLEVKCPVCGKPMKRIPDVIDVWIDSGCADWSVFDYPRKKKMFERLYPVDFIIEGYDQFRGWYYSLAATSKIALGVFPYRAVYSTGFVLDAEGLKMSKSLGNVIAPREVWNKFGADTLRYYQIASTGPYQDQNFILSEAKIKYNNLNVLWNIHRYLIDYSKYLGVNPSKLKEEEVELGLEELWILSKVNRAVKEVTEAFERYELYKVPRILEKVWLELSRTYIKYVREKLTEGTEKQKLGVLYTIYNALIKIVNVLSTCCPIITEAIYQNLRESFGLEEESVHLLSWPEADESKIDDKLEEEFELVKTIIETGLRVRDKKIKLGIRWPLPELSIYLYDPEDRSSIEKYIDILKRKLNVKEIKVLSGHFDKIKIKIKLDHSKFEEKLLPEIVKEVSMRNSKEILEEIVRNGRYKVNIEGREIELNWENTEIEYEVPEPFIVEKFKKGYLVFDTLLTEDLIIEGVAREVIRRIQEGRKKLGLEKKDVIDVVIVPKQRVPKLFEQILNKNREVIGARNIMFSLEEPKDFDHYIEVTARGYTYKVYLFIINKNG